MITNAETIKEAARIDEVIGDFLQLKKKGASLMACCPFHGEKTPSFSVNPARNIFKCFGCDRSGDSVAFLIEHQNMSYPDSIVYLAKKYGIEVEYDHAGQPDSSEKQALSAALIAVQNDFYENGDLGRAYFESRGLTPDTLSAFGVGFCLGKAPQIPPDVLKKAGISNDKGNIYFYNRATLPIRNERGAIVSFAGRTIDDGAPKYLNGAESPVFSKSKVLYGLWENMEYIRQYRLALIVEGYADVMGLYQYGGRQAVASCGTSLSEDQCRLLSRYAPKAIILYDGDAAGRKAAARAVLNAYPHFQTLQVVLLDEGDDPDSFVRAKGIDSLLMLLKTKSVDAGLFFCTDGLLPSTQAGKKAIGARLRELMQTVDHARRAALVDTLAASLGISTGALMRYVFPVLTQGHTSAYAAFQAHLNPFEMLLERRARWCLAQQEVDTSNLDQEQLKAHQAKLDRVEAEIKVMSDLRDSIWAIEEIFIQHLQKK